MKKSIRKFSLRLMTTLFAFSSANTIHLVAQDKETTKEKNEEHYGLKAGMVFLNF